MQTAGFKNNIEVLGIEQAYGKAMQAARFSQDNKSLSSGQAHDIYMQDNSFRQQNKTAANLFAQQTSERQAGEAANLNLSERGWEANAEAARVKSYARTRERLEDSSSLLNRQKIEDKQWAAKFGQSGQFSLSEGEKRFDDGGNVIATGTPKGIKLSKNVELLDEGQTLRLNGIERASKFLQAFNSGAESGATEAVWSFFPGQFTDQAAFNEELDAFAEAAARAQLKANGEIRPTDQDVEGTKRSLFGVGKGEQTNINLLRGYMETQLAAENTLRKAKGQNPMVSPSTQGVGDDWYTKLYVNPGSQQKRIKFEDM